MKKFLRKIFHRMTEEPTTDNKVIEVTHETMNLVQTAIHPQVEPMTLWAM